MRFLNCWTKETNNRRVDRDEEIAYVATGHIFKEPEIVTTTDEKTDYDTESVERVLGL